jgi:hypothetical protein
MNSRMIIFFVCDKKGQPNWENLMSLSENGISKGRPALLEILGEYLSKLHSPGIGTPNLITVPNFPNKAIEALFDIVSVTC